MHIYTLSEPAQLYAASVLRRHKTDFPVPLQTMTQCNLCASWSKGTNQAEWVCHSSHNSTSVQVQFVTQPIADSGKPILGCDKLPLYACMRKREIKNVTHQQSSTNTNTMNTAHRCDCVGLFCCSGTMRDRRPVVMAGIVMSLTRTSIRNKYVEVDGANINTKAISNGPSPANARTHKHTDIQ